MDRRNFPENQGLYSSRLEKDSCGTGFVCDIKGRKTNGLVRMGLAALKKLSHRGGAGADFETGDGAGILLQMPHGYFSLEAGKTGLRLPPAGMYASGLFFLPREEKARIFCREAFTRICAEEGQQVMGWRKVPVNASAAGRTARDSMPFFEQPFVARSEKIKTVEEFEIRLYVIRRRAENFLRLNLPASGFYITGLSSRTFSYKGLLKPEQLPGFFADLDGSGIESAICLFHARYSTNTFPSWSLAQPFRLLAHNGEINTINGNESWFRARERLLTGALPLKKILPVIDPEGSDSSILDNVLEFLHLSGRPLEHALMMLMPEAWEKDENMPEPLRSFYEFSGCMMEPWDGPAAVVFTDGSRAGAALDRNGLRPARYSVCSDGLVIMASEAGVLDVPAGRVIECGRLEPGKMLVADTAGKRLLGDDEIKRGVSGGRPYGAWLKKNVVSLGRSTGFTRAEEPFSGGQKGFLLRMFGYTREDIGRIILPMAEEGEEPMGSMGNDTPPAVLSKNPELVFSFFKQRFAQVTNPPIDPIRENLVMSLTAYTGPSGNVLEDHPSSARKLKTPSPVISDAELEEIKSLDTAELKAAVLPILFPASEGERGFLDSLDNLCRDSEKAVREGAGLLVLSDRGTDRDNAPLPSLLAAGAVHNSLVKSSLRTRAGIIIETAEAREVHHFALLSGCGADLINPYMAFRIIGSAHDEGALKIPVEKAMAGYISAVEKGILKILSRMGISTLSGYKGAQTFECLGLGSEVMDRCFPGINSRIGGMGFGEIAREILSRREKAMEGGCVLPPGGIYSWRKNGTRHSWEPDTIMLLQSAVKKNDYGDYKKFSSMANAACPEPVTLRALLKIEKAGSIPLRETEPVESILKRFAAGAMSFGSISREAHETIALAMNRIGAMSNTGEGGEDPARFLRLPGGDSLRSAVKQVAAGRFGVTTYYLVNADEIQIKIAQGAKPGEGGHLPGSKVSALIASTRYTTPGVTLISPPPHHDIYSIEDLAQLIFDLKNVNPKARISVKLASQAGVGTVAVGAAKGGADVIVISGGDGGTGASPLSSIRHAGLPWELGLSETHQTLVLNGLRERIRVQADGQFRTGRDVAVAAILGAEEFGFGSAILVSLGCLMLRHCHLGNCAMGIATQDEILRRRFRGKPGHIINYMNFIAAELREIMARAGAAKVENLIGKTELLKPDAGLLKGKAEGLDFSGILYCPPGPGRKFSAPAPKREIKGVLDEKLIELASEAVESRVPVEFDCPVQNSDRAVGAMLSGRVCEIQGEPGLPEDTIRVRFRGAAGQSFGAFLAGGVTFELEGAANDYAGKGMFGGKIILRPDRESACPPGENVIAGNTAFYGAIRGEAYINGTVGERFCVRNSGITAVCEGAGDHGCEYMTGGTVLVLGRTGRNFAAGMSGGTAYVYDDEGLFLSRCNTDIVKVSRIEKADEGTVCNLLREHLRHTGSKKAERIIRGFKQESRKILKVVPCERENMLGMSGKAEKSPVRERAERLAGK